MTVLPLVFVSGPPTAHDRQVLLRINMLLGLAYDALPRGSRVREYLEWAQCEAEGARPGPHDLIARDVEYYLKCRWQVSLEEHVVTAFPKAVGGDVLNLFYNAIKGVMIAAGLEEVMRTDKDVPVTPPGGIFWGHKGCVDGLRDDGEAVRKPAPAELGEPHSLPIPLQSPAGGSPLA